MTDAIEKARKAWRELWMIRAEGNDPKAIRRHLADMEVNDLAALNYIEVMEWVFDTEVDFIDIHSDACDRLRKAKDEFEEAVK